MGENGNNQQLAQALEKLTEFLIAKKEDGASYSGVVPPQVELVHKIDLMPNEIKLEGVGNYLLWWLQRHIHQRWKECGTR